MSYEEQLERRVDQLETVIRVLLGGQEEDYAIKLGIAIKPSDTIISWARQILNDPTWFKPETAA